MTISAADPQAIVTGLRAQGINTSFSPPDYARHDFAAHGLTGLVRLSPHAYNTEAEIDLAIDKVAVLA